MRLLLFFILFGWSQIFQLSDSSAQVVSIRDNFYDRIQAAIQSDSPFQKQWSAMTDYVHQHTGYEIISYSGGQIPEHLSAIAEWNRELYGIYDQLLIGDQSELQKRIPLILISDDPNINAFAAKLHFEAPFVGPILRKFGFKTNGLYLIVISSGALAKMGRTRDQVAAILGHELGHIRNGDLESDTNRNNFISKIIHAKTKELLADHAVLDFFKGKFSLRSLVRIFRNLQEVESTKEKPSFTAGFTRTHPTNEVRENTAALAAIAILQENPQFDIGEQSLQLLEIPTYSRINFAVPELFEELERRILRNLDLPFNKKNPDFEPIGRKLSKAEKSKIISNVLEKTAWRATQNLMPASEYHILLLRLPYIIEELGLKEGFKDENFKNWLEQLRRSHNPGNQRLLIFEKHLDFREQSSFFDLATSKENSDFLMRHLQNKTVTYFFTEILVPSFKFTYLGFNSFAKPLILPLVQFLKRSAYAVTTHEVQNMEMVTRRHYVYLQTFPGSRLVYDHYKTTLSVIIGQKTMQENEQGSDKVIDRIITLLNLRHMTGYESKYPALIHFSNWTDEARIEVNRLLFAVSQNFDWQLAFVKRLSEWVPDYFVFYDTVGSDSEERDQFKKMFYQVLSANKSTDSEKIFCFRMLMNIRVHFDLKTLSVLADFFSKLNSEKKRSLFYVDQFMRISNAEFDALTKSDPDLALADSHLYRVGSYYIELFELFYKRGLHLPMNGYELNRLIRFLGASRRYYSFNHKNFIVKYIISELIRLKSGMSSKDFLDSIKILMTDIADQTGKLTGPIVFTKEIKEFSNLLKEGLQAQGKDQWSLPHLAKMEEFNAMLINLSSEAAEELMLKYFDQAIKGKARAEQLHLAEAIFTDFREKYSLHRLHRGAYLRVFDQVLGKLKINPIEYRTFQKKALDGDGLRADKMKYSDMVFITAADGFVEWTFQQDPAKQFEMIEYLLDERSTPPRWIEEQLQRGSRDGEAAEALLELYEKMDYFKVIMRNADTLSKTAVISYFLSAGSRGFLSHPANEKKLVESFVKGLTSENSELARGFFQAMKKTDPDFYSQLLSRILVLKAQNQMQNNDLSSLLVPLIEYFDLPGMKLAQLAHFSAAGNKLFDGLDKFYETAIVLSNSQILDHLQELYGDQFPAEWRIVRPLGFGSVNYAVLVYDESQKREFVLNIPRKNIVRISESKFRQFEVFFKHLNDELKGRKEIIDLLVGLSRFLHRSIRMEFNRPRVFERTKTAMIVYSGSVAGWTFKPIQAINYDSNGVITMSLAPGISLANLQKSNSVLFKQASSAISLFLGERLLNGQVTIRMNTNGDWHPGQFFISSSDRQMTLLDFGQESEMSPKELLLAKDLLTVISTDEFSEKVDFDLDRAFDLLKKSLKESFKFDLNDSHRDEFRSVLNQQTKMARFVFLISFLENKGFEVPAAAGHWIKEVNAILNFERNGGGDPLFIKKIQKELFDHLKVRFPNLKLKLMPGLLGKMFTAKQTVTKIVDQFFNRPGASARLQCSELFK